MLGVPYSEKSHILLGMKRQSVVLSAQNFLVKKRAVARELFFEYVKYLAEVSCMKGKEKEERKPASWSDWYLTWREPNICQGQSAAGSNPDMRCKEIDGYLRILQ